VLSEAVRLAIEEGKPFDVELQLVTGKRKKVMGSCDWSKAYRRTERLRRLVEFFQDINARKLAEIRSLQESEQLQLLSKELEIIIDSIPGLVFYKDTKNRFIKSQQILE